MFGMHCIRINPARSPVESPGREKNDMKKANHMTRVVAIAMSLSAVALIGGCCPWLIG